MNRPNDPEVPLTVLVAEDEPLLREVVRKTLQRAGFEVLEAADGHAGLAILQSEQHVDVLLSDIRMPGLNGYQLAEAALSIRPALKVMLMTGYADEALPESLRRASVPILRKPFDFARLASSLAAMRST